MYLLPLKVSELKDYLNEFAIFPLSLLPRERRNPSLSQFV